MDFVTVSQCYLLWIRISTARANVDDEEDNDDENNEDCEALLKEFDDDMENFKQKVREKWYEPTLNPLKTPGEKSCQ